MTTLADARPPGTFDLALAAGAFDDLSTVAWTSVVDLPEVWELTRGRQHERNATVPTRGKVTLENVDRRFDPTHTAGPYGSALSMPRRRVRIPMKWGTVGTITGATNATPIVVTETAHGRAALSMVYITGVGGNTAANGYFFVGSPTANTYQLLNVYTAANVAGSGAYTSGGTAQALYWRFHGYAGDFPNTWSGPNVAKAQVDLFDAFAIFAEIPIPASAWELVVGEDSPTFWFKPGSGTVAYDVSGQNHHGTYQGRPGFEDGIIPAYDGAGFAPNRLDTPGARASFPHKNLISGYPFTVETVLRLGPEPTAARFVMIGTDAPAATRNQVSLFTSTVLPGAIVGVIYSGGTIVASARSSFAIDDDQIHHIAWVANAYNDMEIWVDGVDVTGTTVAVAATFPNSLSVGYAIGNTPAQDYGDYSFATQDGDALGDVIFYDGVALSSTRIAAHAEAALTGWAGDFTGNRLHRLLDWIGWPSADRGIDAGKTQVPAGMGGGGFLLPYIQKLEQAEVGRTYVARSGKIVHLDRTRAFTSPGNVSQFTFGDGAGEVAYDPLAVWGGSEADLYTRAEGSRTGGPKLQKVSTYEGAAGNPGIRSLSIGDLHVETDEQVNDFLSYQLSRYEVPRPRVESVVVKPQEDPVVVWPKVLGVDDGALVTFTAAPPGGGSEFSQASHLEATSETWTGKDVTITFALSPADLTVYAQFGTAQFGTAIFAF